MEEYLKLLRKVSKDGEIKGDRTGTGTKSYFGTQSRYNLAEGFPLVTTKKTHWKSILVELLWFLKGDTNIKYLVDNGVRIWNEWPYNIFKNSNEYNGESLKEFAEKIKNSDEFAKKWGDLGPVYGKQWRDFFGVDQVSQVMESLKKNPNSRRHIISAWNPAQIDKMALPPCHAFMQFYVNNNKISCQLYQRSADLFLGVPFNIASYSLLVYMIAHVLEMEVGNFVHTIGDAHIYSNHKEQVELQLSRKPRKLPKLVIKRKVNSIFDFTVEDFEIIGYDPHPLIKGKVAV